MTSEIRQQVMARIIEVGIAASEAESDSWSAMEQAFPGLPIAVLAEAWAEVDAAETERWWNAVEVTIDAELVKRAIEAEARP